MLNTSQGWYASRIVKSPEKLVLGPVVNKAHTATLNRICQRYGVEPSLKGDFDIKTDGLIIEVETTASIYEAVEKLRDQRGPVYIAITNKEGLKVALKSVEQTEIGIMDPQGNVMRPSGEHEFAR